MICPRGHAFDSSLGARCPFCGEPLREEGDEAIMFLKITRAQLKSIKRGLDGGRVLAIAAVKLWPEAVVPKGMIEDALAVLKPVWNQAFSKPLKRRRR